jgi:uncharacterized membrane protein
MLALLAALLVAIACGRPPYLVMGGLFLFLGPPRCSVEKKYSTALMGLAVIVVLAWIWSIHGLRAELRTDVDPLRQAHFLLAHPGAVPGIFAASLHHFGLILGMFGILGRLDLLLPLPFYPAACGAFLAGLAADSSAEGLDWRRRGAFLLFLAAGGLAMHLLLYLTWTPVGAPAVEGMQGRYLIPFAMAAGLVLPGAAMLPRMWRDLLGVMSILFAPIGCAFAIWAVLAGY